ncbi:MAG: anaerobic sulfatase maturase [Phycisphaerae bacterium]
MPGRKDEKRFNIMAKPVSGRCNLDCRYCYYIAKPRELYPDVPPSGLMMSDEVLESFTRQYLTAMPVRCDIGWQGGEPLLAGMDFYKRAVELQKACRLPDQVVTNALQTNGTLLDDAWCEFLAANEFLVGISLDGTPQWHDSFRRDHAGGATFHRAWAGLELLRKHKVEFNVLVTLNSANAPHAGDIYRYFVNRGVQYLQFIPVLERKGDPFNGPPTDYSCAARQLGQFLIDVYEQWATRDIGRVSERFIDNTIHTLLYGTAALCCYGQTCANAHVLEFNGDLYACDHFVYRQWRIGNIMERPLAELVRDARLDDFAAMKTGLPAVCRDCQFVRFCNSGCPKHHIPIGTDPGRVNHFCEGYKMFFAHALAELAEMAEHFKAGRIPPLKKPAGNARKGRGKSAGGPLTSRGHAV